MYVIYKIYKIYESYYMNIDIPDIPFRFHLLKWRFVEANATTFSFGPWVTCHCAHGVVEEPEVRIHADEVLPWDGDG